MKSRLISAVLDAPDPDEAKTFARDLADVLGLVEGDRQACLSALPRIHLAHTDAEKERLIERLANDCQVDRDRVRCALGVMDYLLTAFLSDNIPDSDWEFWASDLQEAGHLDSSTRPVFEAMAANIRSELATQVEPESRRRRAAAGVLPVLSGCGVTVEVRSVTEDSYRPGTPIEEFEPQVLDAITVASVAIGLDVGPFKEVFFQADESDIDRLVDVLQAAKKEMAALRRFLKLEG